MSATASIHSHDHLALHSNRPTQKPKIEHTSDDKQIKRRLKQIEARVEANLKAQNTINTIEAKKMDELKLENAIKTKQIADIQEELILVKEKFAWFGADKAFRAEVIKASRQQRHHYQSLLRAFEGISDQRLSKVSLNPIYRFKLEAQEVDEQFEDTDV